MANTRQLEVNYYKHTATAHGNARRATYLLRKPFVVTLLCESCRQGLKGRVEVLHFGAEMDVPRLTCERCGHTMVNKVDDLRWANPVFDDHHWNQKQISTEEEVMRQLAARATNRR